MALSREERRALQDLERQLVEDPQIDSAFSTLPKRPTSARIELPTPLGWAVFVVGAVATIALLTVSFVLSFIGFLVMFAGAALVSSSVLAAIDDLSTGPSEHRDPGRIR